MYNKLLAIRFTALGDVAMTIPVVESFCRTHPEVEVTFLTNGMGRKVYETVTSHVPNLKVIGVNLKKDYAGFGGLNRLFSELHAMGFDAVADLHDVLRTKWLTLRFRLCGTRVAVIDKGRGQKKALVAHRLHEQLKSGFERYAEVFHRLGYTDFGVDYEGRAIGRQLTPLSPEAEAQLPSLSAGGAQVALAPFAQHRGKIYPTPLMHQAIRLLLEARPDLHLYLLGGPQEAEELARWEQLCPERIHSVAGRQSIADDIRLMARLHCVISMDSSNMHLASLVGTPVVSIWGATHPYAGFLGYGQREADVVQLPLPCRPCSIYGNKPCPLHSWRCLEELPPQQVADRVLSILKGFEK